MPRDERSLTWLELDFGHGIWSAEESVSGHGFAPMGAATTDTYGCYSPAPGGLAPLAGETGSSVVALADMLTDQTGSPNSSHLPLASDYQRGMDRAWLTDGKVIGPTIATGVTSQAIPDAIVSAHAFCYDTSAGVSPYELGSSLLVRAQGFATRIVENFTTLNVDYARIGPSSIIQVIGLNGTKYIPIAVASTRGGGPATTFGYYSTFPDETTPTSGTPYTGTWTALHANLADHYIVGILAHQDRIVVIAAPTGVGYGFGPDVVVIGGEELWYNSSHDTQSAFSGPVIAAEGEYSGYGAWASVNANELLLVRHRGGGVLIRGDLESPTVIRLPGIAGTHGMTNVPAQTPYGVAYGTRYGFHLWAGNEASAEISSQLDNDFWISRSGWTGADFGPEMEQPTAFGAAIVGRSTYQAPFLYAPNNFLCDLSSERRPWWRLTVQGQPQINHWDTGTLGVWGFHAYVDKGGSYTRAATHFDPNQPTNLYYWKSLPLTPSRGRYVNVRELVMTCSGRVGDQITVRVSGITGDGGTYTERIVTLAGSTTEDHRLDIDLTATNLQVSVTAVAAGASTNPAPRVHAISLGHYDAQKLNS